MNAVMITGKLARDPQVRMTQNGKAVASFTVVAERSWTANGKAYNAKDYINCVAWGKDAETIGNSCKAGTAVEVKGRIGNRSYEDKNGEKKYVTEVNVEGVEIPGKVHRQEPPLIDSQHDVGFSQFGAPTEHIPF